MYSKAFVSLRVVGTMVTERVDGKCWQGEDGRGMMTKVGEAGRRNRKKRYLIKEVA